jgi:hypothetical protein
MIPAHARGAMIAVSGFREIQNLLKSDMGQLSSLDTDSDPIKIDMRSRQPFSMRERGSVSSQD